MRFVLVLLLSIFPAGCSAGGGDQVNPVDAGSWQDASTDSKADSPFEVFADALGDGSGCMIDGALITVGPDEDYDRDGWSLREGDCNDCDVNTNPGAWDVPGNGVDEDCSGVADDEVVRCDDGIGLSTNVPEEGAQAIGLCRFTKEKVSDSRDRSWGVIASSFELADGAPGMHHASRGVLQDFGPNVRPQQGGALLALSSASARRLGDPEFVMPIDGDMGTTSATPDGWPKPFPSCSEPLDPAPVANDSAALALRIRVPTNAYGLSFRFAFFTTEFPAWVCRQYNDYFVALMASSEDVQGRNLSWDGQGNPISVNSVLLEACLPQVVEGKPFDCLLGDAMLAGNGFGPSEDEARGHGSTGWLETTAAVVPGSVINLRFVVWDAGDHLHGSTVVIDDFRWRAEEGMASETVRVPSPK